MNSCVFVPTYRCIKNFCRVFPEVQCEKRNRHRKIPLLSEKMTDEILNLDGRVICQRCAAHLKSSGQRCQSPAVTGKKVCRRHGGMSSGPKTLDGRRRCAAARTIHGRETRQIRRERSEEAVELWILQRMLWCLGLVSGPNPKGRPPGRKG